MHFVKYAVLLSLVSSVAHAQSDIFYLVIPGIPGESRSYHANAIDVQVPSFGARSDDSTASFSEFRFSGPRSMAGPRLMLASATGQVYPTATLYGGISGQETVTITLSNVIVTSYQLTGVERALTTEQFSVSYSQIQYTYRRIRDDGTEELVTTCWVVNVGPCP